MSARRFKTSNSTTVYLIAIVVIIVAFLLSGGGPWVRGMMHGGSLHGGRSMNMANWNWITILVSIGVGIIIGILFVKRK